MKMQLDCIPCFIRQTLEVARFAAPDDIVAHRQLLDQICSLIPDLPSDISPPFVAERIHEIIRQRIGVDDPYREMKKQNLNLAQAQVCRMEQWMERQEDRFEAAVRLAIAGNIIDLGVNLDFDLEGELDGLCCHDDDLGDIALLREAVETADQVLYIGDNTAEAVFDIFLIRELLPRKVYFATRSRPILNDITVPDALKIGIDKYATVISSGSPIPGTDLERTTPHFRQLFDDSTLVIAKGQGNFESLSDVKRPVFFLFKVKCPVVSELSGRRLGSSQVYYSEMKTAERVNYE
jgi:damage-control phosphatase, subfamily I